MTLKEFIEEETKCKICGKERNLLRIELVKRTFTANKDASYLPYFDTMFCYKHFMEFTVDYFVMFNKLIEKWDLKSEEFKNERKE